MASCPLATQTGAGGQNPDATTWQVWKITPSGQASIFVQGAPLRQPNGIAFDEKGNIVVVNIGNDEVLTFGQDGKLLKTENAAQAGNDGLVIMKDGTKYVSSVVNGGVSRIRPGKKAELIAQNIPNPASMCYDSGANQLVIPMNASSFRPWMARWLKMAGGMGRAIVQRLRWTINRDFWARRRCIGGPLLAPLQHQQVPPARHVQKEGERRVGSIGPFGS